MSSELIISVVGLGYVGLPVAVVFGRVRPTIGFDVNQVRIAELRNGYDRISPPAVLETTHPGKGDGCYRNNCCYRCP